MEDPDKAPQNDPVETLRRQVGHWESRAEEARKILEIAAKILPGMRDSLRDLEEAAKLPESKADESKVDAPEFTNLVEPGPDGRIHLRRADQIQEAVVGLLDDLGESFGSHDIEEALNARGYEFNLSTLRHNLKSMAQIGQGIRIIEPGAGRRPAVYGKLS